MSKKKALEAAAIAHFEATLYRPPRERLLALQQMHSEGPHAGKPFPWLTATTEELWGGQGKATKEHHLRFAQLVIDAYKAAGG